MTNSKTLLAQRDGPVLVLTMNRPEKANAMNEDLHNALVSQLETAGKDGGIRAVLLSSSGTRVFSAGADLKEFSELERSEGARKRRDLLLRTLNAVIDFPKPLVAAVQGKALGAGCMLALLADEVVMADTAAFGLPEIRLGIPTPVGYVILAARGGMSIARQMVQGGEPVDAKQALSWGLIEEIIETGKLKNRSLERAQALAVLSGTSFEANKKFMNAGLRAAIQAAIAEADRL